MAANLARDDLELRRLVLHASIFPVLAMVVVGGVLAWQVVTLRNLAAWVDHTDQVIERVEVISRLVTEQENALRGYLLTGREEFLGPYAAATKALAPAFDDLESLVSDNPVQVRRTRQLRELHDEWRAMAHDLPSGAGSPSAAELARGTNERKAILDRFRDEAVHFVTAEDYLRTQRSARAQRASRLALASIAPALLLIGIVLATLGRRQLRRVATVYQGTARAAALRADLLEESEARFRLFVEGLHDAAVYVLDPGGVVRSWNIGAQRIKGYRADEIIGRHVAVFYTAEDAAAGVPERELAQAAATGQAEGEGWRVRKGGSRFWAAFTIRALRGADGRFLGYAKLVRDTTERKRTEMLRSAQYDVARALAEASSVEQALAPLLTTIGTVFGYEVALAWVPEGDMLRVAHSWSRPSRDAQRLVEAARTVRLDRGEGMAGRTWSSGEAGWVEDARKTAGAMAPFDGDTAFLTAFTFPVSRGPANAGDIAIIVQLLGRDPRARDAELIQLATTLSIQIGAYLVRQLAEQEGRAAARRRAEELERRVQERTIDLTAANRELEAFSYSVSHDLRAPLRALDGFSQALLEDHVGRLDATAQDYLRRIGAASKRMSKLIDDLIRLSRVTRADLTRERVDLSALVREVVAEVQEHEPTRRVEVIVADGVRARGDARLLRAGLANLVGNAFKFTRNQPHARIEFGVENGDAERIYYIRDNGVGFDMDRASKLFQPFQRLHTGAEFEGTGIGLATWQRIVQRHGGRVWAESSPGKGAKFSFTLGDH